MSYFFHLLIYFCIYAILALSLNLIVGYFGLFTMAHGAFFALGAYTYALVVMHISGNFLVAVGVAVAVASVMSLAISLPAWRLRGDSFVLTTIAVQYLVYSIINNWSNPDAVPGSIQNLTNGPYGLAGIPKPGIFGYKLDTIEHVMVAFLLVLVGVGLAVWKLGTSPWGRLLKSMREDELAARGLAKNVRLAKIQALAIGCSGAALAGAMYSSYVSYIDPTIASLDQSILFLSMLIVGGTGNFRGPLVGAAVLLAIPEILRIVHLPEAISGNVRLLAYGVLLVVMVHLRPAGLAGEYKVR